MTTSTRELLERAARFSDDMHRSEDGTAAWGALRDVFTALAADSRLTARPNALTVDPEVEGLRVDNEEMASTIERLYDGIQAAHRTIGDTLNEWKLMDLEPKSIVGGIHIEGAARILANLLSNRRETTETP